MKFIVEGRLPGLNEYTAACRSNKFLGAKMKKEAETQTAEGIIISGIGAAQPPVRVHFTWYEKDERRDPDNVASAKKFIFDAMVRRGVIPNDSRKFVRGFTDEFRTDKKRPRIEVEIEEVE